MRQLRQAACEAYSRVLERGTSAAERRMLAAEYSRTIQAFEERLDSAEVASIVQEAAAARNGWKAILARCSPPRRSQSQRTAW